MIGLKIEDILETQKWKTIEATEIPFEENLKCFVEGSQLFNICTLVGKSRNVRLGLCLDCGHTTYMDKPSREWVNKFYLETWDGDSKFEEEVKRRGEEAKKDLFAQSTNVMIQQMRKFNIEKDANILEIGCGYGDMLRILKNGGYTNLIGIESSKVRAMVAEKAHNIRVNNEAFEDIGFHKDQKFDIIFSYHTLEHSYDPSEVIKKASELQDEGDYLILSLPNHVGEPTMGVFTFLPHLHSFSQTSLTRLLNENGYQMIDNNFVRERSFAHSKTPIAALN